MKLDFSFQKIEPNKSQQLQAEAGTANQEVDNNSIIERERERERIYITK
jgi:hypothetical protein